MSSAQYKHTKSQTHVHCYLQLKLFGKQQSVHLFLDAQHRNDVTRNNEEVNKNIWILRRVVHAVCSLANQEFPFRGRYQSSKSVNKGNLAEFLGVLKNQGPLLENHLNSASVT